MSRQQILAHARSVTLLRGTHAIPAAPTDAEAEADFARRRLARKWARRAAMAAATRTLPGFKAPVFAEPAPEAEAEAVPFLLQPARRINRPAPVAPRGLLARLRSIFTSAR